MRGPAVEPLHGYGRRAHPVHADLLGELTQIVPFEMVDAVLAENGGTQRRLRLLPSRVVVYLLLAEGLFAEMGYRQVWARLSAGLGGRIRCPSRRRVVGISAAAAGGSGVLRHSHMMDAVFGPYGTGEPGYAPQPNQS